jgi:signal transduction histidine kinase
MLQKVLKQQVAGSGLDLRFSFSSNQQRLTDEIEGQILRIAQEALANTVQHARATGVDVRLVFGERELLVEIVDDGDGFEIADAPTAENGHFGITGMRERAVRIGATFGMESDNKGTRVKLQVPLASRRNFAWKVLSKLVTRLLATGNLWIRNRGPQQEKI